MLFLLDCKRIIYMCVYSSSSLYVFNKYNDNKINEEKANIRKIIRDSAESNLLGRDYSPVLIP